MSTNLYKKSVRNHALGRHQALGERVVGTIQHRNEHAFYKTTSIVLGTCGNVTSRPNHLLVGIARRTCRWQYRSIDAEDFLKRSTAFSLSAGRKVGGKQLRAI